jgi:hypothetical protein
VFRVENRNPVVYFRLSSIADILNVIIPLFTKYPIQGSKRLDFYDFCVIAELMKTRLI